MKKFVILLVCCAIVVIGFNGLTNPRSIPLFRYLDIRTPDLMDIEFSKSSSKNGRRNVESNYKSKIALLSLDYDLPESYLLSLIVLECGGHAPCGHRFEPKRFKQLKRLRDGKRRKFEYLRSSDLKGKTDSEIRDFATSWGPFQIMGYHTILLSTEETVVTIEDLKGAQALDIGVQWVDLNYGKLLREERYKDAFHMHNTGRLYPKIGRPRTYDPSYVSNGLAHMTYFEDEIQSDVESALNIPTPIATPVPSDTATEVVFIEFEQVVEKHMEGDTVQGWIVPPSIE